MSINAYIAAARLRTLPLALAGTITGNLLSFSETGYLNVQVFTLSILTAVLLQILSNFANDYGDFKNGVDGAERNDRMMASGRISESGMKISIWVLVLISLFSGILLLLAGLKELDFSFFILLAFGISGIAAAYYYTSGKKPYGYAGLGDIAVFIYFGIISVVGTYYLQTLNIQSYIWWVGAAIGLLSAGVLNVNNIRDMESDAARQKRTIAVRLGYKKALFYHLFLLYGSVFLLTIYSIFSINLGVILVSNYMIFSLLIYLHYEALKKCKSRPEYNKQLKYLSLLILGMMLYFCLSEILFKPNWD